ncbi:MAG: hypothetical protein AAF682_15295 [Planctomycetota bacterium]
MTTSLIVRDALHLIQGEPQGPQDPEAHLRERIEAVQELASDQVSECIRVLAPSAGEDAEPEVTESALLLTLAHPKLADGAGMNAAVYGRLLAVRYEREGDSEAACAVLRVVAEYLPGNLAIERALASLMRRQGMVQELVERYLARAQKLLDDGANQEAIPWLREVLQLDRSRKDVARMIRDLRYDEVASQKSKRRRVRTGVTVLLISTGLTLATLREFKVRQEFAELPPAQNGDLTSLRERLASLETFIGTKPVWHGALTALKERSELRVQIDRLNTEEMTRRGHQAQTRRRNDQMAESARLRARKAAENGDFEEALRNFETALDLASEAWAHRDRTLRDVDAIVSYLAEERDS